ncbi:MAG: MFS transporter [Bacillota bacterium]|nr:MFS transporter [Bacillota bacterium]
MNNINFREILKLKNFLLLWVGQSLSQLGSSITSFALNIWIYQEKKEAMSVALLSFFSYLPYALVGIFAGALIDKFQKKKLLLICDSVSAMCTLSIFCLMYFGALHLWTLCVINVAAGFMNALKSPALKAGTALIVPKESYTTVSGLNSLSDSIISVFRPVLATCIVSIAGIKAVFIIDFITFVIAVLSLLILVQFPSEGRICGEAQSKYNLITEGLQGFIYLKENKGFLYLIFFMAGINFLAAITFFNILPAMILARTSNNENILGLVSGSIGLGGIVGGLLVTVLKPAKNKVKTIFISSALAFLLCDIPLGAGRAAFIWIFAAFIGSLPIPFLNAAENYLLMTKIPSNIQGRIFSLQGSLVYITVSVGYVLGGLLADKVFEPLMLHSEKTAHLLGYLVGGGKGSGMALMFIITGILGGSLSIAAYFNKDIRSLE